MELNMKISIKLKDKEISLDFEEGKILFEKLYEIYGSKTHYYPTYPISYQTYPTYPTYGSGTGNGEQL